jgi:hypothetical protein
VLVALAALASGRVAGAQAPRSVRIDYEAAPGCPDQRSFEGQIRARSSKVVVTIDGATSVRVRIEARGGRFEGDVVLSEPSGREARRHVEGGCSDVASALALITALALDPTASTASDPAAVSAGAAGSPTTPGTAAVPPPPAAPARPAPPKSDPAVNADPERATGGPLREEDARAHSWGWSIGAEAGVTRGVAPSALVSVPAFLDVWRRTGPGGGFSPSVRLRFERADSGNTAAGGPGADFTWTAGSLDLCPVAWSPWRFRFSPCVRVEGGVLSAAGTGVTPVRTDARPWLTVGLLVRARVTVVGSLFAEIEGGAYVPTIRDRFFTEPDSTVQHAPVVAFAGAGGLGVTFW